MIRVRDCAYGKGLFTTRFVPRKTIVHTLQGEPTTQSRTTIHVGDGQHVNDSFGIYLNHSFDPNCKIVRRDVVAIRDIQVNEHLTFDYTVNEPTIVSEFQTADGSWVRTAPRSAATPPKNPQNDMLS